MFDGGILLGNRRPVDHGRFLRLQGTHMPGDLGHDQFGFASIVAGRPKTRHGVTVGHSRGQAKGPKAPS